MIVTTAAKLSVWILTVTLSSAPNEPKHYEFGTEEDCAAVQPFVHELYLSLGEIEVNTSCKEIKQPHSVLQPLNVNMIYSL
jgi:hypothetical protein